MSHSAKAEDLKEKLRDKLGKKLFTKIYEHWKKASKKKVGTGKVRAVCGFLLNATRLLRTLRTCALRSSSSIVWRSRLLYITNLLD